MVESYIRSLVLGQILLVLAVGFAAATAAPPSQEQFENWKNDLEAGNFGEREAATIELFKAGKGSLPSLVSALGSGSPEASQRAAYVLRKFASSDQIELSVATQNALRTLDLNPGSTVCERAEQLIGVARERVIKHLAGLGASFDRRDGEIQSASFNSGWKGSGDDIRLLGRLTSLVTFNASNSPVDDATLDCLAQFPNLESLDLGRTKVTGPGLANLKHTPKLTFISLQGLPIGDEHSIHLSGLSALERLGLDGTKIGNGAIEHIGALASLDTLYLNGTEATDLSPLADSRSLRVIFASSTKISAAGMAPLSRIPSLRYLSLQGSSVDPGVAGQIGTLKQIETLGLDETSITDAGMKKIEGLTNLKKLWVSGTTLTDASIPSLAKLSKLEVLYVGGNKMTAEGVERLTGQLEGCKINNQE